MRTLVAASVVTIWLAGCGGSGDQTTAAATCLKNALANQSIGSGNNNCGDPTAASVLNSGSGTKITVSCTHKAASEYICDVTVPSDNGVNLSGVQGGFFNVTYDGKSIVYQPAQ